MTNSLYEFFVLAVGLILPVSVLALIIYGLYRKVRGRTWYETGTCYIGQNAFSDMQAGEVQQSVQEVHYMEQEEKEEAVSGDDFEKNR